MPGPRPMIGLSAKEAGATCLSTINGAGNPLFWSCRRRAILTNPLEQTPAGSISFGGAAARPHLRVGGGTQSLELSQPTSFSHCRGVSAAGCGTTNLSVEVHETRLSSAMTAKTRESIFPTSCRTANGENLTRVSGCAVSGRRGPKKTFRDAPATTADGALGSHR